MSFQDPAVSGASVVVQSTEPGDTGALWIDSTDAYRAKTHDGSEWTSVSAAAQSTTADVGYILVGDGSPAWWDDDESTQDSATVASGATDQKTLSTDDLPLYCDGARITVRGSNSSGTTYTFELFADFVGDGTFTSVGSTNVGINETKTTEFTFERTLVHEWRIDRSHDAGSDQPMSLKELQPHSAEPPIHSHP